MSFCPVHEPASLHISDMIWSWTGTMEAAALSTEGELGASSLWSWEGHQWQRNMGRTFFWNPKLRGLWFLPL